VTSAATRYPVRVEGALDGRLSRWLWLVKWLLAIPHHVVLAFLWLAFLVLSVIAFVAILITGRYPRAVFEFNVGVLRWTWRVQYYAYGALGTDRYPPFTLADVPDYPARLDVEYPRQLSRGLVLVKWWLLALPHYLVIAVFIGGSAWAAASIGGIGLVGLLVLFAAIALLITGRYPGDLFGLVLGIDRWVLRVAAYAALMTDAYPPFRLDLGGTDPGGALRLAPEPTDPAAPPARPATPWSGGRAATLVLGVVAGLVGLTAIGLGGAALAADHGRDAAGFVPIGSTTVSTGTYAVATGPAQVGGLADVTGDLRIRVTPADPARPVFVGITSGPAAATYLNGVGHAVLGERGDSFGEGVVVPGGPPARPGAQDIWTASASGPGTQELVWRPPSGSGDWSLVVVNADARPGVAVTADLAATAPFLATTYTALFFTGAVLVVLGGLLVYFLLRNVSRELR
jgi:hypothetical protein